MCGNKQMLFLFYKLFTEGIHYLEYDISVCIKLEYSVKNMSDRQPYE